MLTTHILATVEKGRLQKAVEGLVSGAYTITLASQNEAEIRGFVANGDGKQSAWCSQGGRRSAPARTRFTERASASTP